MKQIFCLLILINFVLSQSLIINESMFKTLVDKNQSAGYKFVIWDATNSLGQNGAAGMYICKIKVESFSKTKKMILLK